MMSLVINCAEKIEVYDRRVENVFKLTICVYTMCNPLLNYDIHVCKLKFLVILESVS